MKVPVIKLRVQSISALGLALILFFTQGCKKDDITSTVQPVALNVQVSYEAEQQGLGLPLNAVAVKIENSTTGQSYNASSDDKGLVSFESVSPGNYTISASRVFTKEEYESLTGIPTSTDVTLNASGSIALTSTSQQDLTLAAGRIGDLVFKQIYYAGSNIKTGATFRDQFVEIYNNSNDTIYVDSLYIGSSHANLSTVAKGAATFDWSKSIGMDVQGKDASNDFVYLEEVFMIPGSGKDHPLAPGKSLIIAATGLNHQKPYTDNSEDHEVITVTDPSLTVDLSGADFETYLQDYLRSVSGNPSTYTNFASDLDNPNVPNMVIFRAAFKDWVMNATGKDDFILFRTSTAIDALPSYPDPSVTEITSNTEKFVQLPVSDVIDAVEITHPNASSRAPKRLPNSLDGNPAYVEAGQYSSQSLIRKIAKTIGDRIILQDTNNSGNDFSTKQKADPSKSAASFTTN
ncbi:Protein of unknown function [Arachidicoccus rhizosphaerae]|uniref:DUF4876 domain-containing protein n=1 Tax=Arachidicoccus rhizosphaerae TaxID=551991 RepID=A0A1H4CVU9_9BACT|nr:DUF4876 domain-containing protein [Arachidicoccus rhizosphaerae]SEA64535.1 Protein of unknown function [Arachidicoccus rhizosphaerae]